MSEDPGCTDCHVINMQQTGFNKILIKIAKNVGILLSKESKEV